MINYPFWSVFEYITKLFVTSLGEYFNGVSIIFQMVFIFGTWESYDIEETKESLVHHLFQQQKFNSTTNFNIIISRFKSAAGLR